jgi:hypothetical protein
MRELVTGLGARIITKLRAGGITFTVSTHAYARRYTCRHRDNRGTTMQHGKTKIIVTLTSLLLAGAVLAQDAPPANPRDMTPEQREAMREQRREASSGSARESQTGEARTEGSKARTLGKHVRRGTSGSTRETPRGQASTLGRTTRTLGEHVRGRAPGRA